MWLSVESGQGPEASNVQISDVEQKLNPLRKYVLSELGKASRSPEASLKVSVLSRRE